MNKKYTVHIISHTHWDREWYLNSPYTNEWLIPFFDGLFAMLEKEPEYKFILDGQLLMIEDYFEELSKNGLSVAEAKRKIRTFVQRKSLFIGPYYLQPDWQLISEESLVRNIMIGKTIADSLGGSIRSGWLLDNFGQISQTAQIHEQCGLTGLFVWRGVAMDPRHVTSEFIWEAPDGTRMLSIYLLNSYRNIMRLAEYKSIMKERMHSEINKLKPFATTSHILMMNGYDQEMVPDDIQPLIREKALDGHDFTTVQTDPDSYIDVIRGEVDELQVLHGPLYNGRFISVFPGVMSSRMYLKLQNDRMQKLLEKQVEPLSSFAWLSGFSYEQSQIQLAWKTLLKNHPHDSICGVSIDDVHTDMENRNRQVHAMGTTLLESKISELTGIIDTSESLGSDAVIVFNTTPFPRSKVVHRGEESYYVKNIPAMGYKVIVEEETPAHKLHIDGFLAENQYIKFILQTNGSFTITDKATGREYTDLGMIEDMGDSGDEYNYSYPDKDLRLTTETIAAVNTVYRKTEFSVTYKVSWILDIPASDCLDHTERSSMTQKLPVVSYITVEADSPVVSCKTMLRNTAKDHRMRVLFPSGITASSSWASSPFDITERPVTIADYDESDIPEHVSSVIVGAREAKPSTYFHNNGFIDINDTREGLSVFTKGLPEYQIIDSGTIAVTLFRSVGWIAKDINTRIGDAGPEIYTPDAQCLREMVFEYGVCPHAGDAYSGVLQHAESFNNDLIVVSAPSSAGLLPKEYSWLQISDTHSCLKITACKRSEDARSLIIRGVNASPSTTTVTINTAMNVVHAELVSLTEEIQDPLTCNSGTITFDVRGKRIFTVKITSSRPHSPQISAQDILIEDSDWMDDFSGFPYTDYVTDSDIEHERIRAERLKENIDNPLYRRTALEAQLSEILTRHRKDEETIRSLGYKLNEARLHRRIHDYISK